MTEPASLCPAPAAPNAAAVAALAARSPLLEVGAGTGYWARCLRAAGADVLALDVCPPGPASSTANTYHGHVPVVSEARFWIWRMLFEDAGRRRKLGKRGRLVMSFDCGGRGEPRCGGGVA